MLLPEHSALHKANLWKSCERMPDDPGASERSDGNCFTAYRAGFRPYFGGPNGRTFDIQRRTVAARTWRFSPNIPGLSLVKRTILAAYVWGAIRTITAQRLIDRTKSWEA